MCCWTHFPLSLCKRLFGGRQGRLASCPWSANVTRDGLCGKVDAWTWSLNVTRGRLRSKADAQGSDSPRAFEIGNGLIFVPPFEGQILYPLLIKAEASQLFRGLVSPHFGY